MEVEMKSSTVARIIGAIILFFLLAFFGRNNITGIPLIAILLGFVLGFEFIIVWSLLKK
jgi:hypothetical protein